LRAFFKPYFLLSLILASRVKNPYDLRTVRFSEFILHKALDIASLIGQVDAIKLAISRALCNINSENRTVLKSYGFLTRDARIKESKKYGLKKARKASQYSKR
jgi:small subunit ribosomal protein S9